MFKQISSLQNPEIKTLLNLQDKARERKKSGLFVVEGIREASLAIEGGYSMHKLYFLRDYASPEAHEKLFQNAGEVIEISREIYQKIAYRESTEGIIALVKAKHHEVEDLHFKTRNPLLLIAESPEKPGNIGALLRTADAAGIDAVIIANPTTDIYNPNVIRSSVGCVFTTQIVWGSTTEILRFLKARKFQILTAALTDTAENYLLQDYTVPTAIVVGTEATGLTPEWLQASDRSILIPMRGKIDSMNVSVSAAILLFEAIRQRS